MKPTTIYHNGQLLRGIHNVKANLVSYVLDGRILYAPASAIVSYLLIPQAF